MPPEARISIAQAALDSTKWGKSLDREDLVMYF
jgi:flagellum-specific peptidoglycan hydrolase FlgJ